MEGQKMLKLKIANKCPCCEELTIYSETGRNYTCKNCNWEDDAIQLDEPDFCGGANKMSLNEARRVYREGKKVI